MDAKHFPRPRLLPFLEELERRDTPTFALLPAFTAGVSFPTVVASADLNGDGIVDVAVGNIGKNAASSPSIGIALGVGDGTFKAGASLTDAKLATPQSLVVADLNGDGIQDLAVGSSTTNGSTSFGSLLVFLGKGGGTFDPAIAVDATPTIAVGVADFNNNGKPDLVQVTPAGGTSVAGFQIFSGLGDGSFAKLGAFQFFPLGVSRVATADFDKDGFQDFAALDSQANQLFTFFGDGAGNFTRPGPGFYALASKPTDVVAGDFNGDGLTDLVVAEDTRIVFIGNLGSRLFDPVGATIANTIPSGQSPTRLATADLDLNGIPDVIAVDSAVARAFTSNGGGTFTPDAGNSYAIPGATTSTDVAVADVNGDGLVDFVVSRLSASAQPSDGLVFLNRAPAPTGMTLTPAPNPGVEGSPVILTAGITFAGTPIPVGTLPTGTVQFESDGLTLGTATLTNGTATIPALLTAGVHILIARYSGDARFKASVSSVVEFLVNPPLALKTFDYQITGLPTQPGLGPDHVASASFTNDGVSDIVLGSGSGRIAEFTVIDGKTRQELYGEVPFGPEFTGGVMVAAGDIDGDGVADVAVAADVGGGPRVRIYFARGNHLEAGPDFFALDSDFRGGLRVALGDVNRDGRADLVVAGGPGAGPRVATYSGLTLLPGHTPERLFNDFFALDAGSRLGLFVAVGDLNADGFAEIAVSSDAGGGPRVSIFDGHSLTNGNPDEVSNFFVGDSNGRGGIRIAIRDVSSDEGIELLAGDGPTVGSTVRLFSGLSAYQSAEPVLLFANEVMPGFLGGVYVA